MKIYKIKISGYRGIPFCATYTENPLHIAWGDCPFSIKFPIETPFISALIGPNSCGKSSVFYALQYFFSSTTALKNDDLYYFKNSNLPIIIECTLFGSPDNSSDWISLNCYQESETIFLTLISVTTKETRTNYIRRSNGEIIKQTTADKQKIIELLPNFRLIPANGNLNDEVNPEKKSLVADLIEELISETSPHSSRSVQSKIKKAILELDKLVSRESSNQQLSWKEIRKLEDSISSGLLELSSGKPEVRFNIKDNIPTIKTIFTKGKFSLVEGVEIDFDGHGLGIQRMFLISVLNTWASSIGHKIDNQDYFFAIEEPELYLHPHAIRALLEILSEISKKDQVIFSTHAGEFVNSVPLDNVIKIHSVNNQRRIKQPDLSCLRPQEITKIQRYLLEDKSDMLFARSVLLVEGQSELFAFPGFAKKRKIDLNKKGISIVFTNGKHNFATYHQILSAFEIPHVIFADGDGQKTRVINELSMLANEIIVLEEDFEYLIASNVSEKKLLSIINNCRKLQGKNKQTKLSVSDITEEQLTSGWWNNLKDDINADVIDEHRIKIKKQQIEIKKILSQIAQETIANGYLLPSAKTKRLSKLIKNQTKPLAGKVIGESLTEKEINKMSEIIEAFDKVVYFTENY